MAHFGVKGPWKQSKHQNFIWGKSDPKWARTFKIADTDIKFEIYDTENLKKKDFNSK